MTAELVPLAGKTSTARIRLASDEALTRLPLGVPVLEFKCQPRDMGRRAKHFTEHFDEDLLGEYKQAAYEVDGVLVYLQFYRHADDGTMTLFVDLAACVEQGQSPLALAARTIESMNLDAQLKTFVHTRAEELFWQRVDPLLVVSKL